MASRVGVFTESNPNEPLLIAKWCDSFFCRLRGLMFRRELPEGVGLVLVESREGVANTAIHMFAVPFAIGVLWVNRHNEVVDKVIAKPWRIYSASRDALYIVEGQPDIVDRVEVGERVEFSEIDAI
jgi:uncharacterized membrane protein (UPF0127 family)